MWAVKDKQQINNSYIWYPYLDSYLISVDFFFLQEHTYFTCNSEIRQRGVILSKELLFLHIHETSCEVWPFFLGN